MTSVREDNRITDLVVSPHAWAVGVWAVLLGAAVVALLGWAFFGYEPESATSEGPPAVVAGEQTEGLAPSRRPPSRRRARGRAPSNDEGRTGAANQASPTGYDRPRGRAEMSRDAGSARVGEGDRRRRDDGRDDRRGQDDDRYERRGEEREEADREGRSERRRGGARRLGEDGDDRGERGERRDPGDRENREEGEEGEEREERRGRDREENEGPDDNPDDPEGQDDNRGEPDEPDDNDLQPDDNPNQPDDNPDDPEENDENPPDRPDDNQPDDNPNDPDDQDENPPDQPDDDRPDDNDGQPDDNPDQPDQGEDGREDNEREDDERDENPRDDNLPDDNDGQPDDNPDNPDAPDEPGPDDAPDGDLSNQTPGGVLEGRVTESGSGESIVGAELTFEREGAIESVISGLHGSFVFAPAVPGQYALVSASAPGYMPYAPAWGHSPIVFTARRGERISGITIPMRPAVTYTGRVQDARGRPVQGANVELLGTASGSVGLSPLPSSFTTDAAGQFRFVASDGAVLEARHPQFRPGRARVDFATQVSRELIITLVAGDPDPENAPQPLGGQVLRSDRSPIPNVLVVAADDDQNTPHLSAVTDANGRFLWPAVDPGNYDVSASFRGYSQVVLQNVAAGTTNIELFLTAGGRLSGRVTSGGQPVTSFVVWVGIERGPLQLETYLTRSVYDALGRYDISSIASGTYRVTIHAAGYSAALATQVVVDESQPGGTVQNFQLVAGGRIGGVVRTEGTGAPIAGARVSVEGLVGFGRNQLVDPYNTVTNGQGHFEITGIRPGTHALEVSASGHHGRVISHLQVRADQLTGPLTIQLAPLSGSERPGLELAGIGAVLAAQADYLEIRGTIAGGGAAQAGLVAGDRITVINGTPVVDLGFGGSIQQIRGPEGSTVLLRVLKAPAFSALDMQVRRTRVRT